MATEQFKAVMKVLTKDYVLFAKHLNEKQKETSNDVKPESFKITLKDYAELYLDYLSIHNEIVPDDDYPSDSDEPEDEETY